MIPELKDDNVPEKGEKRWLISRPALLFFGTIVVGVVVERLITGTWFMW